MTTDEAVDQDPSDARKAFMPPRWIVTTAWRVHRGLYRWSGGRFGLRDAQSDSYGLAQLTTTGRKSGEPRSVMIGFYVDGDDYVTMAMNGWAEADPAWWLNLQANPAASLVLPDGEIDVVGRSVVGAERDRLWARWRGYDKKLDGWAARRPGETAVVVLTPVAS